jgi:glutamate synthase (NADPH/NADH) large chain
VHVNEDGDLPGFSAVTVHGLYPVNGGGEALRDALDRVRREVSTGHRRRRPHRRAVRPRLDRAHGADPVAAADLAVHHHLIREKTRTAVGLVVESGDAREIHHMALLIGYGAAAVNPYLAFETIEDLMRPGALPASTRRGGAEVRQAAGKGVLKVMSKMGISTIASYTGAQVFEALGLSQDLGRRVLHRDHEPPRRHRSRRRRRGGRQPAPQGLPGEPDRARPPAPRDRRGVPVAPRRRGAPVQPADVFQLQHSTRAQQYDLFKQYTATVDGLSERAGTLRGLFASRRGAPARADRRGRAGERDRDALQHRGDVARLDQPRGPPDARHRDEPPRRAQQHR